MLISRRSRRIRLSRCIWMKTIMICQDRLWTTMRESRVEATMKRAYWWWAWGWWMISRRCRMISPQQSRLGSWVIITTTKPLPDLSLAHHSYQTIINRTISPTVYRYWTWAVFLSQQITLYANVHERLLFLIFSHQNPNLLITWTTLMGTCMGRGFEIGYRKSLGNWRKRVYLWSIKSSWNSLDLDMMIRLLEEWRRLYVRRKLNITRLTWSSLV